MDPELPRDILLRCPTEAIEPFGDSHLRKANRLEQGHELCLRQSTGNSSGPQINVAPRLIGYRCFQRNVGQEQLAAGFQHSIHFAHRGLFFGD